MNRQTISVLLTAAALPVLAGCMTVPPHPGGASGAASHPAHPRLPQARGHEELGPIGSGRPPHPSAKGTGRAADRPAPERPVGRAPASGPLLPAPRPAEPRRGTGAAAAAPSADQLCALGRRYGGWPQHSAQNRICQETYGG